MFGLGSGLSHRNSEGTSISGSDIAMMRGYQNPAGMMPTTTRSPDENDRRRPMTLGSPPNRRRQYLVCEDDYGLENPGRHSSSVNARPMEGCTPTTVK